MERAVKIATKTVQSLLCKSCTRWPYGTKKIGMMLWRDFPSRLIVYTFFTQHIECPIDHCKLIEDAWCLKLSEWRRSSYWLGAVHHVYLLATILNHESQKTLTPKGILPSFSCFAELCMENCSHITEIFNNDIWFRSSFVEQFICARFPRREKSPLLAF